MFVDFLKGKNIIFLVLGLIFLIFIAKIFDIALMFFAAFIVSCTLIPVVDKMEKYMPRALAVSIVLLLVLIGILLVFIPLTIFTLEQGYLLFKNLPQYVLRIQDILSFKILGFSPATWVSPEAISGYMEKISSNLLSFTIDFTKTLASSMTTGLAITIMVFYICYDRTHIENSFLKLFPQDLKEKTKDILNVIMARVGGFVFGQLLAMVFVGIITAVGLALIGNPHAIVLGFVTFVLDIVPVIGPCIVILLAIFSMASKGFGFVILAFLICLIAQILQNQLLRPVVLAKLMDMHPLLIIISLLIGAKFLGVWGAILAPAIASVTCILIDELYIKQIEEKG